jgi:hypothetical protein
MNWILLALLWRKSLSEKKYGKAPEIQQILTQKQHRSAICSVSEYTNKWCSVLWRSCCNTLLNLMHCKRQSLSLDFQYPAKAKPLFISLSLGGCWECLSPGLPIESQWDCIVYNTAAGKLDAGIRGNRRFPIFCLLFCLLGKHMLTSHTDYSIF